MTATATLFIVFLAGALLGLALFVVASETAKRREIRKWLEPTPKPDNDVNLLGPDTFQVKNPVHPAHSFPWMMDGWHNAPLPEIKTELVGDIQPTYDALQQKRV